MRSGVRVLDKGGPPRPGDGLDPAADGAGRERGDLGAVSAPVLRSRECQCRAADLRCSRPAVPRALTVTVRQPRTGPALARPRPRAVREAGCGAGAFGLAQGSRVIRFRHPPKSVAPRQVDGRGRQRGTDTGGWSDRLSASAPGTGCRGAGTAPQLVGRHRVDHGNAHGPRCPGPVALLAWASAHR